MQPDGALNRSRTPIQGNRARVAVDRRRGLRPGVTRQGSLCPYIIRTNKSLVPDVSRDLRRQSKQGGSLFGSGGRSRARRWNIRVERHGCRTHQSGRRTRLIGALRLRGPLMPFLEKWNLKLSERRVAPNVRNKPAAARQSNGANF